MKVVKLFKIENCSKIFMFISFSYEQNVKLFIRKNLIVS